MKIREGLIAVFIIALVVTVAVWSRFRYMGQEGYEEPLRWKVDEHEVLKRKTRDDA